jgi:hypothetical protein
MCVKINLSDGRELRNPAVCRLQCRLPYVGAFQLQPGSRRWNVVPRLSAEVTGNPTMEPSFHWCVTPTWRWGNLNNYRLNRNYHCSRTTELTLRLPIVHETLRQLRTKVPRLYKQTPTAFFEPKVCCGFLPRLPSARLRRSDAGSSYPITISIRPLAGRVPNVVLSTIFPQTCTLGKQSVMDRARTREPTSLPITALFAVLTLL